ncbi:hypothetical protein GGS26DRAFT_594482 [Hypomontagnella submonticulosa]|nr:hypothetical protein GGS26DRAFT_594482 [Hypomontagnella submonticulosa]
MDPQRRSMSQTSTRSWRVAKVVLHITSIVFCAIVIGLSAATTWEEGDGVAILTIPIAAATAAWTIAELVTLWIRRRSAPGRGIHCGAHVGVQLVIFLAMILALFYSCGLWRSVQRFQEVCNTWERDPKNPDWVYEEETFSSPDGTSETSYYCPPSYVDLINSASYRAAVQALIAAIHFSLFVRACVETQRRNSEPPVVMMYPQQAWPAQYGGYPPSSYPQGDVPRRGPGLMPTKETHY